MIRIKRPITGTLCLSFLPYPHCNAILTACFLPFRLLVWIKTKIPSLSIANFTTDWRSGIALGALVDSIAPGLCPDWKKWSAKNALTNAKEAISLAEYWLSVHVFVTPEEFIGEHIDERSMIAYLSQYLNAKIRSGAPLRAKRSSNR